MKKMYCPQCGGEIILVHRYYEHTWQLSGDRLIRCDNELEDSDVDFQCENDKAHNIEPTPDFHISIEEFEKWMEQVLDIFYTM